MKICLLCATFGCGGAERVLSLMANHWVAKGYDITLMTFEAQENTPFFKLHESVRLKKLGLTGHSNNILQALQNNAGRIAALRRNLKALSPDVLISFGDQTNVVAILASIKLDFPVIVSERIHPFYHDIGKLWNLLRRATYRLANAVVVQADTIGEAMPYVPTEKLVTIPNPIIVKKSMAAQEKTKGQRRIIIAAGRLHHQKGFDILINAFAMIAQTHLDWCLHIYGEGDERNSLQKQIRDKDLKERVLLLGTCDELQNKFMKADFFVLSSRYEGYPNVLCETMAYGKAVVATNCPGAVGEIVQDGINGTLVPCQDTRALAEAIHKMIVDPKKRESMGEQACRIRHTLSLDSVMSKWDSLIQKTKKNHVAE